MYLGTSDAIYLAERIADNWKNGEIEWTLNKVKELNPCQAMYVFGLLNGLYTMNVELLSRTELNSLMSVLSNHLNDK